MKTMMYRGYPLARSGNTLYYGYMGDPYVVMLQTEEEHEVAGIKVAAQVRLYKMSTDQSLPPAQSVVRSAQRQSLYEALSVAHTWLERDEK